MPNFATISGNILTDSGISNVASTSGTSGTNGISGTNGLSGTSGTSGLSQTSGTSGVSGSSGTSGVNGNASTSGTSGTAGTNGVNGSNGISGSAGISGISPTSTNGVSGSSGTLSGTWSNLNGVAGRFVQGFTNGLFASGGAFTDGNRTYLGFEASAAKINTNYRLTVADATVYAPNQIINIEQNISSPFAFNNGGSGYDLYIDYSGFIGVDGSSIKFKGDVQSLSDVSWLNQLRPVSFNYRKKGEDGVFTEESDNELWYGLIAEEVEEVNPEIVAYETLEDGSKKIQSVYYKELLAPMLFKLQQLDERLKNLESQ